MTPKAANAQQADLGFAKPPANSGTVECLGKTFENDDARRDYFLGLLAYKLQDAEFRSIDGFPNASDEDILALSDPPYYTACPNPFLAECIQAFRERVPSTHAATTEPFAADVSVGRYSAESLAHSYHTKVPARAILRYLLHFTRPSDVVLDGFCGTGMTGIATQLCDTLPPNERREVEAEVPEAVWGPRFSIVSDLAPAATFIAANYYRTSFSPTLEEDCDRAIDKVRDTIDAFYKPDCTDGQILHVVWSDVFTCRNCTAEIVYWSATAAMGEDIKGKNIVCPGCGRELKDRDMERVFETSFDPILKQATTLPRSIPVQIAVEEAGKRTSRPPTEGELRHIERAASTVPKHWVPVEQYMGIGESWGDTFRSGYCSGTTHVHQFFKPAVLHGVAALRSDVLDKKVRWGPSMLLTATMLKLTRMMRYMSDGIGRIQNGVIYFPSVCKETNPVHLLDIAKRQLLKLQAETTLDPSNTAVSTGSATNLSTVPDASVDYIFVDPPFGDNLQYSELNFLWESWLRVRTARPLEAVVSKSQAKSIRQYAELMTRSFREFYRVLKPGKWITVEFHNSSNAVWNGIQQAMMEAGFVVADVRVLDKKQGAFNQVVAASSVQKDLVISAYRPLQAVESALQDAGPDDGVWSFVRGHLNQLPILVQKQGVGEALAERQDRLLYDRVVAFFVQRGIAVPISAGDFYQGLAQRFPERDGMYFLPDQVAEYDRKRTSVSELRQLSLFVNDEASAIQWVRQQLQDKPQSFQDLTPQYMREVQAWAKHEKTVELKTILEQSFLHYEGRGLVPSQIHRYLSTNYKDLRNLEKDEPRLVEKARDRWYVPDPSKQAEREAVREKSLLREFEEYKTSTQRKLNVFRTEAVRAGFKACWQERDYGTIVKVAEKLPEAVLQEDEKLLMYYDNALTRLGDE